MSVDIHSSEGTKIRFKETDPITWGVAVENTKYLLLDEIYLRLKQPESPPPPFFLRVG